MHVSHETPQQTERRLLQVMFAARFQVFDGYYGFRDHPLSEFPAAEASRALAMVRDEQVWSVLAPYVPNASEKCRVFSFHFPPQLDNSGFVGWLASHLKATLGSGVSVVCGFNKARGGIFDYWCVPESVADQAIAEVRRLRSMGVREHERHD